MGYIEKNRNPFIDDLCQGILLMEDLEECYKFFSDLFTVQEINVFAQRFQVAKLLKEGKGYQYIHDETASSTATITRINACMNYGTGGYRMILDRLEEQQKGE